MGFQKTACLTTYSSICKGKKTYRIERSGFVTGEPTKNDESVQVASKQHQSCEYYLNKTHGKGAKKEEGLVNPSIKALVNPSINAAIAAK